MLFVGNPCGQRVGDQVAQILEVQDGEPGRRHVEVAQQEGLEAARYRPASEEQDAAGEGNLHGAIVAGEWDPVHIETNSGIDRPGQR
ncbi:MAG: hypothetical protein NVS3B12_16750 [Acidimicrobiales bacterium]